MKWLAILALLALPAAAEEASFSVSLLGLTAATLSFDGTQDGQSYRVQGRIRASGVVAIVARVRYDASASGRVAGNSYTTDRYEETTDTGSRKSEAVIAWTVGTPKVVSYASNEPALATPADTAGTVDPLTALYATLRETDRETACQLSLQVFDGQRRSSVALGNPQAEGTGITCRGEYRRLSGFTDKEMRRGGRFPFTVVYEPTPEGRLRVTRVEGETVFGRAVMRRR